jgi:alanyl-tRNA synthetase
LAREKGPSLERPVFEAEFQKHQAVSREGSERKFAGGLADHSEQSKKFHTATHLLHQALRSVLGDHVFQKGSNITRERLRFDFSHPRRMTEEEKKRVEALVNEQIQRDLPVRFEMLTVEEARARGAIGLFEDRYATFGDKLKVYFIGNEAEPAASAEICGGPHVERTGLLGRFRIQKEEASSARVRRIKGVLD